MAFNPVEFVDAWRSGRDLKNEVRMGYVDVDNIIKQMEHTVNSQEGFHPDEEQWKAIRAEVERVTTEEPQPTPQDAVHPTMPPVPPPASGSRDVNAPKPTVSPTIKPAATTQSAGQHPEADDPKHPESEKQADKDKDKDRPGRR